MKLFPLCHSELSFQRLLASRTGGERRLGRRVLGTEYGVSVEDEITNQRNLANAANKTGRMKIEAHRFCSRSYDRLRAEMTAENTTLATQRFAILINFESVERERLITKTTIEALFMIAAVANSNVHTVQNKSAVVTGGVWMAIRTHDSSTFVKCRHFIAKRPLTVEATVTALMKMSRKGRIVHEIVLVGNGKMAADAEKMVAAKWFSTNIQIVCLFQLSIASFCRADKAAGYVKVLMVSGIDESFSQLNRLRTVPATLQMISTLNLHLSHFVSVTNSGVYRGSCLNYFIFPNHFCDPL